MIEQGRASLDDVGSKLQALGPADVRLLVHRDADEISLVTVVVNAGLDTTDLADETYDYGEVAFVKAVLDAGHVAEWLQTGTGEAGGLTFIVRDPNPNCSWDRSESRTHARYGTFFRTPHTDYHVLSHDPQDPLWPGTVLAGTGLPFFPDVNVAAASLLFDVHSMSDGRTVPSELMLLRIAHPAAYFEKLRVSSASIVASVRGNDLEGVCLQVTTAGGPQEVPVGQPGDAQVPVAGADRADTWVALTRGQECLDFRTISSRWPASLARQGIHLEPEDLGERLDLMRRGGESETVEFKRTIPKGAGIPRTVAAFANGEGGTIIVGIEDETGEVIGVANAARCQDDLIDITRTRVRPPPECKPLACTLQGRPVVAMRVEPGDDRPYGVVDGGGIRYYVRRGATNRVAEPEEMRQLAQSRESEGHDSTLRWE